MPPLEKIKNSDLKKKTALVGFLLELAPMLLFHGLHIHFTFFTFYDRTFEVQLTFCTRAC
jgi:hypothetical protein